MPETNPTPTPSHPAFQQPPATASQPVVIPVSIDDFNRYRGLESQLQKIEAERSAERDRLAGENAKALAEKGEIQKALEETRKHWESKHSETQGQLATFEKQVFSERRDAVLASALTGREFISEHAAQQLRQILTDQFETQRVASGSLVVREKVSGRPAADALRELLDAPTFAHFFKPTSRGGAGTDGARPAGANAPNEDPTEAYMARYRAQQEAFQSMKMPKFT